MSHWRALQRVVVSCHIRNEEDGVVEAVLDAAHTRQFKENEYSVSKWREAFLRSANPDGGAIAGPMRLAVLTSAILQDELGLHLHETICCWLNRVGIEMIYGMSPNFNSHREVLIPLLMGGPTRIDIWSGSAETAAFGLKLLIREVFGNGSLTNLLHIEKTTAGCAEGILRVVSSCPSRSTQQLR